MRLSAITAFSPYGVKIEITASPKGSLEIDRALPTATLVDIRDDGMTKHQDGKACLVAQVPSSWVLLPRWEPQAANDAEAPPPPIDGKVPEPIRHSGAVIPSEGCVCHECNEARARKRTENSGKSPKWKPPELQADKG